MAIVRVSSIDNADDHCELKRLVDVYGIRTILHELTVACTLQSIKPKEKEYKSDWLRAARTIDDALAALFED